MAACAVDWCISNRAPDSVYCPVHRDHPGFTPEGVAGWQAMQDRSDWLKSQRKQKKAATGGQPEREGAQPEKKR